MANAVVGVVVFPLQLQPCKEGRKLPTDAATLASAIVTSQKGNRMKQKSRISYNLFM
jgi:hypothetical protein